MCLERGGVNTNLVKEKSKDKKYNRNQLNFLLYIFIIKLIINVECFPFEVESFFELRFCKTSRRAMYDVLTTLETRVLLQRSSAWLLARIYGSRICTVFIRKNWLCHGAPFAQPVTRRSKPS
jgi:hypothetical protein